MALAEILARKREDVSERMRQRPLESFRDAVQPSDRRFDSSAQTVYILECKRASPSAGVLQADLDVDRVARAYAPFATAISVLTDRPYFNGSFDDLAQVRARVQQPVLCKDFVIDPYQVYEARHHGADMVLLMLSVLDDDTWRRCQEVASRYGMTALTEVHDEGELARAQALGASLVGVNNRNLKTLAVDLSVSERLLPSSPCRISESGLSRHDQVRRLRALGYHGFLVGSALMKAPLLEGAVRQLVFGNLKVCGLRRPEDAAAAWDAGATWGGMILAPRSARQVTLHEASLLRDDRLRWVGVFVDAALEQVVEAARELGLAAVQLHGDESHEYATTLRPRLPPGCEIWKALRVRDSLPAEPWAGADRVLLDTWRGAARGGTGQRWDWSLLQHCAYRERVMLSGGLDPETAAAADALDVWGLDVNSGVEIAPGIKHAERLQAFTQQLRG